MSARDEMQRIIVTRITPANQRVFVGTCAEVHKSMTTGSEVTGSLGQPVGKGDLRLSYIGEFLDESTYQDSSGLPYAAAIEAGIGPHGPLTLRSTEGQFHARAVTVAGIPRIVANETRKVRGGS